MAPIVVTIPHTLGKEEALRRLKPALGTASQTFPLLKVHHEVWAGDRVDFKVGALGQMVSGQVTVGEREVRCELTLPWLLHKFAAVTQKVLTTRGQALLEKK